MSNTVNNTTDYWNSCRMNTMDELQETFFDSWHINTTVKNNVEETEGTENVE